MDLTIAGLTAVLLTLFDLDRTFYVPAKVPSRLALWAWWWGFILINGLAAAAIYVIFKDLQPLQGINPIFKAVILGVGYLAVIRAKFTTVNIKGTDVPLGPEALYEGAKGMVYRRINRITKAARFSETNELAKAETLDTLVSRAKLSVNQDALLSLDEKSRALIWILTLLEDKESTDEDKRLALADFLLSGQRGG